jgi:hypothetical protein
MATRKRKRKPWNADFRMPGVGSRPESPAPAPMPIEHAHEGHTTPAPLWACLRCERLAIGKNVEGLDHAPRCKYRDTGEDPKGQG